MKPTDEVSIKELIETIDEKAEKRDLPQQTKEVASVLARRNRDVYDSAEKLADRAIEEAIAHEE